MMKLLNPALVICLATVSPVARSQTRSDVRLTAVYADLVGSWTGQNKDLTGKTEKVTPLRIEITPDAVNNRLRWDYFYGAPGKKPQSHAVRFLKIDPDKKTVSFYWSGDKELPYRSENLKEVLSTGLGEFRLYSAVSVYADKILYRATFQLTPERLDYLWQFALEGKGFSPMSRVTVLRVTKPTQAATQQQRPQIH